MGEFGGAVKKGRDRSQSGRNFRQGGGIGGTAFYLGKLGTFGSDGQEGYRKTHRFSEADHGEVGAV